MTSNLTLKNGRPGGLFSSRYPVYNIVVLVHSRLHPSPKVNGPRHSVCENLSKGGNRCGKAASHLSLCPSLGETSVPTRPSFVLCPPVLKQSLTAGCNGEVARGFGRCCWESYLEALFSFSPTGCPDSKPLFRKAASGDRPYASRVRAFSSVCLGGHGICSNPSQVVAVRLS